MSSLLRARLLQWYECTLIRSPRSAVGVGSRAKHSTVPSVVTYRSVNQTLSAYIHLGFARSKLKHETRKHILKHDKPFKCDIPNCSRATQGFTTTNDLERHKKSVHRIGLRSKSYQCASTNCKNKEKIWPRLDNFRQHIDRMHGDEDALDLVKRYNCALLLLNPG